MLEKPPIYDQAILDCLQRSYHLQVRQLSFLPLGADVNTAVYRVEAQDGGEYFLKLRRGRFEANTVTVPQFLQSLGIQAVIPPLSTVEGAFWAMLGGDHLILSPFIEGKNGYETALSEAQWLEFGAALRAVHDAQLPDGLKEQIPAGTFADQTRALVQAFLAQAETRRFDEPTAAKTAAFLRSRRSEISRLVLRAQELAEALQTRRLEPVLCHADLHPGNLLIGTRCELLKIVDWDALIYAPRELDLALIGGTRLWNEPRAIELFYQGYGEAALDAEALRYYRLERILTDIAEFCKQLLWSLDGGEDREQSYLYLTGQFEPGNEVSLAMA